MQEKFAASYFANAIKIIEEYSGDIPFHHFLKNYFSQNRKFGSKDRKYISSLCYSFFRTGHAIENISIEDKLKTAFFLCCDQDHPLKIIYHESWIEKWNESITQKIDFIKSIHPSFHEEKIFTLKDELSSGIDHLSFSLSHLIQPLLFLRIRPGKKQYVLNNLDTNNISYKIFTENCIAFENATQLDKIVSINRDAVVQDYSSQRTGEFMEMMEVKSKKEKGKTEVWDCCAASGGKSILAYDTIKNISLTVSDIRPSILNNLKKRFTEAGIRNYTSFVADLSVNSQPLTVNRIQPAVDRQLYSAIICDAPCSGSGTWGRTPEQLFFFDEKEISSFSSLQKKIAGNAISHLEHGGYFLYITCSVFKKENEDVAEYIKENFHLTLLKMEVLKGYEQRADTMFAALFIKE